MNDPSGPLVSYSGPGTASGYVNITPVSAGGGQLAGMLNGSVSIGGTSLSFVLQLGGAYQVQMPTLPSDNIPTTIMFNKTFYASAH